jgi:hypothetical protein
MGSYMQEYTKTRDRKLMKYVVIAAIIAFIMAVAASILVHQFWLDTHPIPNAIGTVLSLFGL